MVILRTGEKFTSFIDVPQGEIFDCEHNVYIKTEEYKGSNAVNLVTGRWVVLPDDAKVKRLDGQLRITE